MADVLGEERDLASLVVPTIGGVVAVDEVWEPVRLLDSGGCVVAAVRAFLQDLQAAGRSTATQRSYPMDLLRWFRFGWAIDVHRIGLTSDHLCTGTGCTGTLFP